MSIEEISDAGYGRGGQPSSGPRESERRCVPITNGKGYFTLVCMFISRRLS